MEPRLQNVCIRISPHAAQRAQNTALRCANVALRLNRMALLEDADLTGVENLATRLEEGLSCVEHALTDLEVFAEDHGQ